MKYINVKDKQAQRHGCKHMLLCFRLHGNSKIRRKDKKIFCLLQFKINIQESREVCRGQRVERMSFNRCGSGIGTLKLVGGTGRKIFFLY